MTALERPDLSRTLGILLAGGQGSRLHDLTQTDCKPALPFGENRRIVDFTIANAHRSGLERMIVATQYRAASLHEHIAMRWGHAFDRISLRHGPTVTGREAGYVGTASVLAANMAEIDGRGVEEIVVLSGDHIYDMDYAPMIAEHRASGAEATLAVDSVPISQAHAFGVVRTFGSGRIQSFMEKPSQPPHMPGDPMRSQVSMGIYVFNWKWLRTLLIEDAADATSGHDFGHDILPRAVKAGVAHAFCRPLDAEGNAPYWRDVGTLDAFRRTWLDLRSGTARCRLPDRVAAQRRDLDPGHFGWTGHSLTTGGLSLLAPATAGRRWTLLDGSIVMPGATVEAGARLTNVIVAPDTHIPTGLVVGEDALEDARWFRTTREGTVLVTQAMLDARAAGRPLVAPTPAAIAVGHHG